MSEEFKDAYLLCCNACEVPPRQLILDFLEQSITSKSPITSLKLNGNCKEMFNNKLTDNEVQALCETIQCVNNVRIEELDLSFNLITDEGAKLLADLVEVRALFPITLTAL